MIFGGSEEPKIYSFALTRKILPAAYLVGFSFIPHSHNLLRLYRESSLQILNFSYTTIGSRKSPSKGKEKGSLFLFWGVFSFSLFFFLFYFLLRLVLFSLSSFLFFFKQFEHSTVSFKQQQKKSIKH